MAGLSEQDLTRFAEGLTISRAVFAEHYDRIGASNNGSSFKMLAFVRDPAALNNPSHDNTVKDIVFALTKAQEDGWLSALMMELLQVVQDSAPGEIPEEQSVILQAAIKEFHSFVDAKVIEAGTLRASRRCCSISVVSDDPDQPPEPLGSGFLIGPNLVLTNFHVVKRFIDADGKARPFDDGKEMEFRFDHYPKTLKSSSRICTPAADWLLAFGRDTEDFDDLENLRNNLDYAVIRLRELPGHARGWYRLGSADWPHPAGTPETALNDTLVQVWQFPRSRPMQVADGHLYATPQSLGLGPLPEPVQPPRFMHDANTDNGASGGLVVNSDRTPIALHTGVKKNVDLAPAQPDQLNFAVPLPLIHKDCGEAVKQAIQNAPKSVPWTETGLPIIGREKLSTLITDAERGGIDIIVVETPADPVTGRRPNLGRTFTHSILAARLQSDQHHIVSLSAAHVVSDDAVLTARRILREVDADAAATFTPIQSGQVLDGALNQKLVEDTVAALVRAVPGRTIWIMIDDLDAHTIRTQLSASNFLMGLYRKATTDAPLKFVLVGLNGPLNGLPEGHVGTETLTQEVGAKEVSEWLEGNLASTAWPSQVSRKIAGLVESAAQDQLDPKAGRMDAIGRFLVSHAKTAFRGDGS